MTKLCSDNVKRLMSQYKFKLDTSSKNEDLFCTLCHNLMMDAYQTHCGCQYCHACIAKYLVDGEKHCQGGKEECLEEYLILENNVSKSSILDKKISKVLVHCPKELCQCIIQLKETEEHLKICKHRIIECPYKMIGCSSEGAPNDKIMAHLNDGKLVHSQLLIGLFNNLKDEFTALREIQRNEKIEGATLKRKLETEVEHLKVELKKTKIMVKTARSDVATFSVNNFDLRKTSEEKVLSPYFYSHTNGYKLRLSVYPGGRSDARGSHLSVFMEICKGEYDDILPWPCRRTFTVSITNQRDGGTHVSETLYYLPGADNIFDKPINGGNGEYGIPKFVSHADLQTVVGLEVDDCVIVQCDVSDLS